MSHDEIAIGLGIARNTLEKHFQDELSVGSIQRRLEVLNAMHSAARKGNVTAQKAYLAFIPKTSAPKAVPEETTPKAVALGKKEQANVDAVTAAKGTGWDDLLPTAGPVQ